MATKPKTDVSNISTAEEKAIETEKKRSIKERRESKN